MKNTEVKLSPAEREKKVNEFLSRGVEDVFVLDNLRTKLLSGKKLRIKLGVDPTSSHIHIGRAVPLRKLRDLQNMGHQVVFIVGDFTARIGDASDKLAKRPMLSEKDIKTNLKTYKEQVGKIINLKKAEFHYNSKWLKKLNFAQISELAETFSLQQMIERRNFSDRLEKGEEISLRELLYPLMQGYDSVAVKADIELGGFDQLFNLKAGRVIQKHFGQPLQDVITFKMLLGTDGRKMSSSWGNIIAIDEKPSDMYGKIMSLKDELIPDYFLMATDVSLTKVEEVKDMIANGENPKRLKMELAREIVTMFHGEKEAAKAEDSFTAVFSKRETPTDMPTVTVSSAALLSDTFLTEDIVKSKSDFARLVREGAISLIDPEEKKVSDIFEKVTEGVYRVGKHRFIKIKVK
jgi:tyrosyl-tRNA synthetase